MDGFSGRRFISPRSNRAVRFFNTKLVEVLRNHEMISTQKLFNDVFRNSESF